MASGQRWPVPLSISAADSARPTRGSTSKARTAAVGRSSWLVPVVRLQWNPTPRPVVPVQIRPGAGDGRDHGLVAGEQRPGGRRQQRASPTGEQPHGVEPQVEGRATGKTANDPGHRLDVEGAEHGIRKVWHVALVGVAQQRADPGVLQRRPELSDRPVGVRVEEEADGERHTGILLGQEAQTGWNERSGR